MKGGVNLAIVRHTISLSDINSEYATKKSKVLFNGKVSTYINYLINKEREKESNEQKNNKSLSSKNG